MPIQVIDRSGLRAQATLQRSEDLSRGIQQGAFLLAYGLNNASKEIQEEKRNKLAVMATLASKYGFNKLGPDFMTSFESLADVKFPRDQEGKPFLPMTDEEALQAKMRPVVDKVLNNPNDPRTRDIALGYLGLTDKPKSQSELDAESTKTTETARHNRAMEGIDALKANAAMINAQRERGSSGRLQVRNEPSGYMRDPTNSNIPVPWDGKGMQLKQYEFDNMSKDRHIKTTEQGVVLDRLKGAAEAGDKEAKQLVDMLKLSSDPKIRDSNVKDTAYGIANDMAKTRYGVTLPTKDPGFLSKVWKAIPTWKIVAPEVEAANQALGVGAPSAPSVTDDALKKAIQEGLANGMHPADIIDQAPDKFKAAQILKDLVP